MDSLTTTKMAMGKILPTSMEQIVMIAMPLFMRGLRLGMMVSTPIVLVIRTTTKTAMDKNTTAVTGGTDCDDTDPTEPMVLQKLGMTASTPTVMDSLTTTKMAMDLTRTNMVELTVMIPMH